MARKSDDDVISTRLRLPAGLHRMVTAKAKQNNRSFNSEILWCIAHQYGGEATKHVAHLAAEQRRVMYNVLRALVDDPERAAKIIAGIDKETEGEI